MAAGLLIGVALAGASNSLDAHPARQDRLEQQLIALETESWEAWQRMDSAFWTRFLSDDHVELNGYFGPVGKESIIAAIASKQCTVRSYAIDHFSFFRLDARNAVLIYRAEQDSDCGGTKVPSPVWATSLYQLRDGRWQNLLYEHTPKLDLPTEKMKPSVPASP